MPKIHFQTRLQTTRFHNPLKGGELDVQESEIRIDPLTGRLSFFNPALEGKIGVLFPDTDEDYLRRRAEETAAHCFMCNGRWKDSTPRYPDEFIPGGRLVRGDTVLFPNLFPLSPYHAVVVMGDRHFRRLDELPAPLLRDALELSIEFIRRCRETDPGILYFTINCNYLFPAGASVIHPHLQLLGSPFPSTIHDVLLRKTRLYFEENDAGYWRDLLATEMELAVRDIGRLGRFHWLTAFSPVGANEINAILPDGGHFLDWTSNDVADLADGLSRVLRAYHDLKCSTFNFSCFCGPIDRHSPEFGGFLRIVNRQNATPHYRADDYFFQKLLGNEIIVRRPEQLASIVREYF